MNSSQEPAAPAPLPDRLLGFLFFLGVVCGVALAARLGDPKDWKDTTPQWLALTSACVASAYLLLVKWQDELTDAHVVAMLKRLVELLAPAVLLSATFVSSMWTVTDGGAPDRVARGAAMVIVALLVLVMGVLAASMVASRAPRSSTAPEVN